MYDCVHVVASPQSSSNWDWMTQFAVIYNHISISIDLDWNIQAKVAIFIRWPAAMEKHFHPGLWRWHSSPPTQFDQSDHTRPSLRHHWSIYVDQFGYDAANSGEIIYRRRRSSLRASSAMKIRPILLIPLQNASTKRAYFILHSQWFPHETIQSWLRSTCCVEWIEVEELLLIDTRAQRFDLLGNGGRNSPRHKMRD